MTEETENLVLEMLRAIRAENSAMKLDIADIKARMTSMEGILGHIQVQIASHSARLDRVDQRLERIEKRLTLVEA